MSTQERRRYRFETLEPRLALAAQPVITEFLASNDGVLLDDNGNSSDWIELFNAGDEAVDLAGYTLTDDPADPSKWAFPSVTLEPNRHLVVFAGVDDNPAAGSDLYTGFGLLAAGEYVGLFNPEGLVLSEFSAGGANYPAQREDVSYGIESVGSTSTPVPEGSNSQYLVPNATTGPLIDDAWRQPDYVLGTYGEAWQAGPSGFGYERGSGYEPFIATDLESLMYNQTASAYIRSTFDQDTNDPINTLKLRARYDDGFVAFLNGVEVIRANGPAASAGEVTSIPLDNLFDDAKGTPLGDAIVSDTYQAEAEETDLGVYAVELGTLNQNLAIAPNTLFNLATAGGGSGSSGPISNDTFRAQSPNAIRTIGVANPPTEKVEDGIGIHSNGLVTFDLNELRAAGGFGNQPAYFTARQGVNDTAVGAGELSAVAILSDASGQVLAGYVNGQQVGVSEFGGVWSFTGSQPPSLSGSANNRFAPLAMPIPAEGAYLTLAITGLGSRSSDHGVFSNPRLEFQSIALGNLFDDAKGASLSAAVSTDTRQARGDTSDLGVVAAIDGGFQSVQTIAPNISFDLSNVGDSTAGDGAGPGNDTYNSAVDRPIRTRNLDFGSLGSLPVEDGVGLQADELITFDIEELRAAGGLSSDLEFRFKARAGVNDEADEAASGLAIVLASDAVDNVLSAWVNGEATSLVNDAGVWSMDFPNGPPAELTAADNAVDLDLALPSNAAYVTLIGAGGETTSTADRIVFSGARLSAVPDADGLNWQSIAGASNGDSAAVLFEEFDLTGFTGLLRDGENVLAVQTLNRSTTSSDFLFSHEIVAGRLSYSDAGPAFFTEPSPGDFGGEGVQGFTEGVAFSVERGFHDTPFGLAITTPTPGASIYYTTDFSLPGPDNPTATLYTGQVTVDKTTVVRAAAFRDDFAPSYIDTTTYVFVEDVLQQDPLNDNGAGVFPDNGLVYPTTLEGGIDADLSIDPEVLAQWDDDNPANTDFGIRESLKSLPVFSLTLEHGDAWRPLTDELPGILTDARNRGEGFRHAASIEYFDPATGDQFQANAAVQAQGNSSRGNGSTRQHSYRLIFNRALGGPGKLNFPLFDNSDFADINTFTLKVASTDGFSHDSRTNGSFINPINSTYTRDAFIRQLHFNTGNVAADHTFAHVYINGLYWGLYIPIERPDDAFFSDRFGGEREDWDIFRDNDEFISGNSDAWNQMTALISALGSSSSSRADELLQQLQGNNPDGTPNPAFEPLMDVDNFIDYYAIHMSNNTLDWPHRNWYAARNRVNPGKGFQFIAWDQGQSLSQDFIDRTERQGGLGTVHARLQNSPEYRLRFADRIQKHFFNDGALTLPALQQTWSDLNNTIEPAVVAETARWGDSREGEFANPWVNYNPPAGAPQNPNLPVGVATTVPTLTIDNWRTNVDFVHDDVLPFARGLFFDRMLVDGLWIGSVAAPQTSINGSPQHGGPAAAGDSLSLNGSGTIYYTLDGSDPRELGGAVAGTQYTGPIALNATTVVKARSLSGGLWSPLTEATFTLPGGSLAISEINYNPYAPTAGEALAGFNDNDDFEFVEIVNTSATTAINLDGTRLAGAVDFTFGVASLAPGERAVVVEDTEAFRERYGESVRVLGQWSGGLSNGGETLRMFDGLDNEIVSVAYNDNDPWNPVADGGGATLVLDDPAGTEVERLGKSYAWRHSAELGGSPGAEGEPLAGVVINEVLAHTDLPQVDTLELYNPTDQPIDIGGWFLSDNGDAPLKFEIPAETILGPGQYLTLDEDDFAAGPNGFRLSAEGDEVYLVDPTGPAVRFVDVVDFGATLNGESVGRSPNGIGRLMPMVAATFGAPNSAVRVGPLVISELNYHPSDPSAAAQSAFATLDASGDGLIDNDLEFIEIHNPTDAVVSLADWRLRGESDYDFAPSASLAPGETLVVVPFDPLADAARLAGFRAHYGIEVSVQIVGGFEQNLGNGEARVELQSPDAGLLQTVYVTADETLYDDLAPWPNADGSGSSLERVGPTLGGESPSSWLASTPTPGMVDFTPTLLGDYNRNGIVDENDYAVWAASYGSTIASNADGNDDGFVNAADYTIWRDNLGQSLPPLSESRAPASASSELVVEDATVSGDATTAADGAAGLATPPRLVSFETLVVVRGDDERTSAPSAAGPSDLMLDNAVLLLAFETYRAQAIALEAPNEIVTTSRTSVESDADSSLEVAFDKAFDSFF